MDSQVENAIQIAWDPTSSQELKGQAFDFLNQLRSDPSGWQVCLTLFTRFPRASEVVRLVSLEVVNNAVQSPELDGQSLDFLRASLLDYVRRAYGGSGGAGDVDSPSLQNKLTQTLTFLFISLYKDGWTTFVDDFLALTSSSPGSSARDNLAGTTLYLRILGSIHDEIADVLMSRSGEDQKRNTELKDIFRARDVAKVAASWQEMLAQWSDRNDVVVEMCLKVIGRWVSWTDISLVVNQELLNFLFRFAGGGGDDRVRNAAIDCFAETVAKKMKSADKVGLVVFLNLGDVVARLIASPALAEQRSTPRYDTDLAETVARLVSITVTDLVRALEDSKAEDATRAQANELLQNFLPFLLRLFSDEYDEICSTVIPSLTDLLTFLRKIQPLPSQYSAMLPPILNAIIAKMRYDETSSWGNEDEQTDEAEFQELRKKLQNLQKSVAAVDQALYIDVLSNVVGSTFQNYDQQGGQVDWRDLDLALHVMYLFGELAVPNGGLYAKSQPSSAASERLVAMMTKMVQSGIANFAHPAIQLQYMEICVRYWSFFEVQTSFIAQVLEEFVSLVHSTHVRVRTRSWYLFQRFVKHLRSHVGTVTETVIQSIRDLLPIKAEVPKDDADDDMSSDESDHSADAVFNSQLYLYEAIGCIASTSTTPVQQQALYAQFVMYPLFSDMEQHLPKAKDGDAQAILQVHHIIMALGSLAHGFSDWRPGSSNATANAPAKEVSDEFVRAAVAILVALESLKASFDIRTAARSAFSRLLGVLGASVLPQLRRWIDGLLSDSSSRDEMATFLRLLDQVVFGFKSEIYEVLDALWTPLLQRVFAGLAEPVAGTDDEIQLAELRRELLSFVQIILANGLDLVLVSGANDATFGQLIASVTALARAAGQEGTGGLAASRLAFAVLSRMAALWGGPDVVAPGAAGPTAAGAAPAPKFPGFEEFLIRSFHPVCWEVLRDPHFRPRSDAQARTVLVEVANLELTIYAKTGPLFVKHLEEEFFPALGMPSADIVRAITHSKDRQSLAAHLQLYLNQREGGS